MAGNIKLIYFSYKFSIKNLIRSPLLISTKALNALTSKPSIDHVAILLSNNCRYDLTLEAMQRGVVRRRYADIFKGLAANIFIEEIDFKEDETKSFEFCKKYLGKPYSYIHAAVSGMDLGIADNTLGRLPKKGMFCSYLVCLYLIDQGVSNPLLKKFSQEPYEATPADIFVMGLGEKCTVKSLKK